MNLKISYIAIVFRVDQAGQINFDFLREFFFRILSVNFINTYCHKCLGELRCNLFGEFNTFCLCGAVSFISYFSRTIVCYFFKLLVTFCLCFLWIRLFTLDIFATCFVLFFYNLYFFFTLN